MSEVNATGMKITYPGVCKSVYYILLAHIPRITCYILAWADSLHVLYQGFLRPKHRTVEVEAYVFYVVWLVESFIKCFIGFRKAEG